MAATPQVVGPCLLFTQAIPGAGPSFLGTTEVAPSIVFDYQYADFVNALAGVKLPMDQVAQGDSAIVVADVNRWDEVVLEGLMLNVVNPVTSNKIGTESAQTRGTLMIGERQARTLWMVFPYANKPVYAGVMPQGYRFFSTWLISPMKKENLNTTPMINRLIFRCLAPYNPALGTFTLYDFNVSGMPAIS